MSFDHMYPDAPLEAKYEPHVANARVSEPVVMDLRRLTDAVLKLQAQHQELERFIASLRDNQAGHERLLGQIGAYDAAAGESR